VTIQYSLLLLLLLPPLQLKAAIMKTIGAEGKFLRLIVQGKLLAPDTSSLSSYKIEDRAVVHCVVSERPPVARPIGEYYLLLLLLLLLLLTTTTTTTTTTTGLVLPASAAAVTTSTAGAVVANLIATTTTTTITTTTTNKPATTKVVMVTSHPYITTPPSLLLLFPPPIPPLLPSFCLYVGLLFIQIVGKIKPPVSLLCPPHK